MADISHYSDHPNGDYPDYPDHPGSPVGDHDDWVHHKNSSEPSVYIT